MKFKCKILMFLLPICLSSCTPKSVSFTLIPFLEEIDIHTSEQITRFFENPDVLTDNYLHYLDGLNYRNDYSKPYPVHIDFSYSVDRGHLDGINIEISESSDFTNSIVGFTSGTRYDFYNGKIGTDYYYRLSSCGFASKVGTFTIKDNGFRLIDIDGVANVRDIGGNGHIKQGLIYRGSALEKNENDEIKTYVTNLGKNQLKQLGIKTEIDVRKNIADSGKVYAENCGLTKSKVADNYVSLPMYYGGKNILTFSDEKYNNPLQIKAFFELIANQSNFPVYMHCSEGKDRTGCLSYLVEALLGESEEYMYRDYVFSNFANVSYSLKPSGIDGYYGSTLKAYKKGDEPFNETVYNYLNEVVGISKETLNSVIENLKDGTN